MNIAALRTRFDALAISGKLVAVTGLMIALLLLTGFSLVIWESNRAVQNISADAVTATANAEAAMVERDIARVEASARSLAAAMAALCESGQASRAAALAIIRPQATSSALAIGAWFMAEPNAFDGNDAANAGGPGATAEGHFMPYWVRDGNSVLLDPGAEATDYQEAYYRDARDSGRAAIIEPYVEDVEGNRITMTSIAVPVKRGENVIGVAGIDIALDDISARLGEMRPFETGRIMLLSGDGNWIAHPDQALRMQAYGDPGREALDEALRSGQTRILADVEIGGVEMVRVVRPIRMEALGTTWALVMDVPASTINAPSVTLAWELVVVGLLIVGAVLAGLFFAVRALVGRPMNALSGAVDRLAKGEQLAVPMTGRQDEIGTLARAADVFRQAAEDRAAADAANAETQRLVTSAVGSALAQLAEADLTARIHDDFPGGYAVLKTNFNEALARLTQTIGAVKQGAGAINTGASEIAQASEDLARRTEQNAAALEETAAALAEVEGRVRSGADAAAQTVQRADEAKTTVGTGRATAAEAVGAMHRVQGSATAIDEVIEGMDKIAFQTRVLAMNAAVEAGRAGEAGRGFAVVADLVSALAMRAEEEAKRARDQLTVTQADIGTAVDAVQRVDQALANITSDVDQVHSLLGAMARDNEAQSASIGEISGAVFTMDQMTQQNAAMVEQTSAAARNLANEVAYVAGHAEQFRTDEGRSPVRASSAALQLVA